MGGVKYVLPVKRISHMRLSVLRGCGRVVFCGADDDDDESWNCSSSSDCRYELEEEDSVSDVGEDDGVFGSENWLRGLLHLHTGQVLQRRSQWSAQRRWN